MLNKLHITLKRIIISLLFWAMVIGGAIISTKFFKEPYSYVVAGLFGIIITLFVIKIEKIWKS